jgi:hypothetical protein
MDTDDELENVKLVRRGAVSKQQGDLDPDSPFDLPYHNLASNVPPSLTWTGQPDDSQLDGHMEIDLPDKLRHVLALSSSDSRLRNVEEETIVASLLYGRREACYDPIKGGEIWDVGEQILPLQAVDTEGEDDWEGQPVPWEVGEL